MAAIFTRRAALAGLAAAAGALCARSGFARSEGPRPTGLCVLTPQSTEGPFYFDPKLLRADIAEGRPGAPLELVLDVVEAGVCAPLAGARVDVWHADALGAYSGYDGQGDDRRSSTRGETFLRGAQLADGAGRVRFRTIWPGWYRGRTTHIHVKVRLDDRSVLTGQLYFPDDASDRVYASSSPYRARAGERSARNANDSLFRRGGVGTLADVEQRSDGFAAGLTLAIESRRAG